MKCINPVTIIGGDKAGQHPCGHCPACLKNKVMQWSARILHETEEYKYNIFVTLTYKDELLPISEKGIPTLKKEDLQKFIKRLRKSLGDLKIKYFACGEYGENTNRPHYHLIIMGLGMDYKSIIDKAWGKGFITVSPMKYERIKYTVGYVLKKQFGKKAEKEYEGKEIIFQVQSQGIGARYVERNMERLIGNSSFTISGVKNALPRYYKDKMEGMVDPKKFENEAEEAKGKVIYNMLSEGKDMAEIADELIRIRIQKVRNLEAKMSLKSRKN